MKNDLFLLIALSFTVISCATVPVVTSPMVSMTEINVPKGAKLKSKGDVNTKYCHGEDPALVGGMAGADEVIMKAQKESGGDYIKNAVITRKNKCFMLNGVAVSKK